MLKPAQLYKDELQTMHDFVSIGKNGELIGYIGYRMDWSARVAYAFSAISFDKDNMTFIKDIQTAVFYIFRKYHMNRIEWSCYADNPAIKAYRQFIKRYGGRECGYERECTMLLDGKLHDAVKFEILAKEFNEKAIKPEHEHSSDDWNVETPAETQKIPTVFSEIYFESVENPKIGDIYFFFTEGIGVPVVILRGHLWEKGRYSNFWEWRNLKTGNKESGYGSFYKIRNK